jgi:hypothetical protein
MEKRATAEEEVEWVDRAEYGAWLDLIYNLEDERKALEDRMRREEQLPVDHPRTLLAKVAGRRLGTTKAELEQAYRERDALQTKDLSLPRRDDSIQKAHLREHLARTKSRCFTLFELIERSDSEFIRREREGLLSEALAEVRRLNAMLAKLQVDASEPGQDGQC